MAVVQPVLLPIALATRVGFVLFGHGHIPVRPTVMHLRMNHWNMLPLNCGRCGQVIVETYRWCCSMLHNAHSHILRQEPINGPNTSALPQRMCQKAATHNQVCSGAAWCCATYSQVCM
jgi:hypothetical protein